MIAERKTKVISVGDVKIGGQEPVRVQSMTNTDTRDADPHLTRLKSCMRKGAK